MATYAAGALVERRYPGPDADSARAAATPQIDAFVAAGFVIAGERWIDDESTGAPIGDAIASGPIAYVAGRGGSLLITYQATVPADLPTVLPRYTLQDPRAANLRTISQLRVAASFVAIVLFVAFFLFVITQMLTIQSSMPHFGP